MKAGLLWYDDDPRHDLIERVNRAAKRYREKHNTQPNVCYVHRDELGGNGKTAQVGKILVTSLPTVLLHHLWLGVEEDQ